MAVSSAVWVWWLAEARAEAHREALRLAFLVDGPLGPAVRVSASFEWMEGPFADAVREAVRTLARSLAVSADGLARLTGALERAEEEARAAVTAETAGLPALVFDPWSQLGSFRTWGPDPCLLNPGWSHLGGGNASGYVAVVPEQARLLVRLLREAAGELRSDWRRLQAPLAQVGLEGPRALLAVADAAGQVADELERRVNALEAADAEAARRFAPVALPAGLTGLPGRGFDPGDAFGSAVRRVVPEWPPPAGMGPGRQPAQAKEADPVSTSTGNYVLEVVDLAQPARGVPTVFARTYNSLRAGVDGPLGFGWAHNLGVRLAVGGAGARIVWGDGHEDHHRASGSGFASSHGVFDRLRTVGDGFELATKAKVVYSFDAAGLLVAMADRSGNRSVFDYDDPGLLVRLTDASGVETIFEHDGAGRVNAVAGILDRRWSYRYTHAGELVAVTDPEGGETVYEYDSAHRLVVVVDPEERLVVRNRYDDEGRVVEQEDGAGGVWRYSYQPNLTVVTDPLGWTKAFAFDAGYRTTAVADATAAVTRFRWDDASNLTSVVDASGRVYSFGWDHRGNLTSAEGPDATRVSLDWDEDDNLSAVVSSQGDRASFAWDHASRPVVLCSPAGITTTVTWRDDGLPETVADGAGAATRYRYDNAGRLASATDPLGATTAVAFDAAGRPVAETHPEGAQTTFEWNRADRLVAVTDATGATTRYAHDRSGRLVSTTDTLGRVTRYRYDRRGFLASVTDPLGRETTFAYDPWGRLASRNDARGLPVSFSYDPAGRLVRVDAPGVTPITYTWDPTGRLVAMRDETGETTWELDPAGRPLVEHRPDDIDLTHAYDGLGRRRRVELRRDGELVGAWDHEVDADGRITAVKDNAGSAFRLAYDATGRPSRVHYPNGVVTTWSYDAVGQPLLLELAGPDGSAVSSWAAGYDGDGNRTRSERRSGSDGDQRVVGYAYDDLGRLISARGEPSGAYTWDATHNRTAGASNRSASFDAADQILTDEDYAYRHDEAGHLLARNLLSGGDPVLSCQYDALGRAVALQTATEEVRFAYDGLGRRTMRGAADGPIQRVFDGVNLLAEVRPDGHVDLETTAGLVVLARRGAAGTRYLHPGLNTEVAAVTDETGNVVGRYDYSPFGERTTIDGDPHSAGPLGYCGTLGVREELGGLLDMRARLYDPTLGRFTSPDPWPARLPEPITLNRYLYALGDPISQVDPYGLFCFTGVNEQGKCRGLKDVAKRVAEPIGKVSTVATGIAAVMAGITVVCPLPCGPITGTAAAVFEGVAMGAKVAAGVAGFGATTSECIGSGVSFGCLAGAASSAVSSALGFGLKVGQLPLGLTEDVQEFARWTFSLFLAGAGHASERTGK